MRNDYIINTSAPQTQRIYDWQKDSLLYGEEWFVNDIYCGNCHAKLEWAYGLVYFCPKCGFRIVNTQNPTPPGED